MSGIPGIPVNNNPAFRFLSDKESDLKPTVKGQEMLSWEMLAGLK